MQGRIPKCGLFHLSPNDFLEHPSSYEIDGRVLGTRRKISKISLVAVTR
jgi:hypothetical protein